MRYLCLVPAAAALSFFYLHRAGEAEAKLQEGLRPLVSRREDMAQEQETRRRPAETPRGEQEDGTLFAEDEQVIAACNKDRIWKVLRSPSGRTRGYMLLHSRNRPDARWVGGNSERGVAEPSHSTACHGITAAEELSEDEILPNTARGEMEARRSSSASTSHKTREAPGVWLFYDRPNLRNRRET